MARFEELAPVQSGAGVVCDTGRYVFNGNLMFDGYAPVGILQNIGVTPRSSKHSPDIYSA
jgi:hypothetical protein